MELDTLIIGRMGVKCPEPGPEIVGISCDDMRTGSERMSESVLIVVWGGGLGPTSMGGDSGHNMS